MSDPPKYWGTPSGEVIKAIVYQGKHSWREIQEATGLGERELNRALAILYNDVLTRDDGDYRINLDLESEYLAFQTRKEEPEARPITEEPKIVTEQASSLLSKVPIPSNRVLLVVILIVGLVIGGSANAILSNPQTLKLKDEIAEVEEEKQSLLSDLSDAYANLTEAYQAQGSLLDQIQSLNGDLTQSQEEVANLTGSLVQSHAIVDVKDPQISGLEAVVTSLNEEIEEVEQDLDEAQEDLEDRNTIISVHETTIVTYEAEIFTLETQVQNLEEQLAGSGGGTPTSDFIFVEASFSRPEDTSSRLQYWIGRAEESIKVMMYLITQNELADALKAAHDRGIQITVIIDNDWVDSSGSDYQTLLDYGIDIRHDDRSGTMHHKVMVIDDWIVIVGSYNWSASAEDSNDENIMILKSTIIAAEYLDEFDRILEQTGSQAPTTYYTLTISTQGSGTTNPSGSHSYEAGSTKSVTATAASGWDFSHWKLDGANVGRQSTYVVSMNQNHALVAVFTEESSPPATQYTLTISVSGSGSTTPSSGSYQYDEGSGVSVSASEAPGWDFDNWLLDGGDVGSQNPYSVTMDEDYTLVAVFEEEPEPEGYVVINEVEQNPPGNDNDGGVYEWVELYNPSGTAVDIGGWTLTATGGSPVTKTISQGTVLQPGQRKIIQSGSQWLDNSGEKVVLKDDQGNTKNSTPTLNDSDNDNQSWQRSSDGGSTWVFKTNTKNSSN